MIELMVQIAEELFLHESQSRPTVLHMLYFSEKRQHHSIMSYLLNKNQNISNRNGFELTIIFL